MIKFNTLEEVQKTCKNDGKKYMVYGNDVLDVEKFEHPGPQELIVENIGTDCTELFDEQGHSKYALELCQKLKIGYLQPNSLLENKYQKITIEEQKVHDSLDAMIDIKKPLVPQVRKMTNRQFLAFVKRPRHVDHFDGIIFHEDQAKNDGAKVSFSNVCKILIPFVFADISLACYLSESYTEFIKSFGVYFTIGLCVAWTLTEYIHHRFLLHQEVNLDPNGDADPDQLEEMFCGHLQHHVFMNQWYRIPTPVHDYAKHNAPFLLFIMLFLKIPNALLCAIGCVVGCIIYDGVHLAYHFNINLEWVVPGFKKMKAQHMRHHFRDSSKEFGVTTDLWDIVLGTMKPSKSD